MVVKNKRRVERGHSSNKYQQIGKASTRLIFLMMTNYKKKIGGKDRWK